MITQFKGKYRFLSNFFIEPDDSHIEGEYQSAKTLDKKVKDKFKILLPAQAKSYGRTIKLRPDWNDVKLQVMEDLVRAKFQDSEMKKALLATGDEELQEGNWWGDRFWGVCHGYGENHLGKILMKIRNELRKNNV